MSVAAAEHTVSLGSGSPLSSQSTQPPRCLEVPGSIAASWHECSPSPALSPGHHSPTSGTPGLGAGVGHSRYLSPMFPQRVMPYCCHGEGYMQPQ